MFHAQETGIFWCSAPVLLLRLPLLLHLPLHLSLLLLLSLLLPLTLFLPCPCTYMSSVRRAASRRPAGRGVVPYTQPGGAACRVSHPAAGPRDVPASPRLWPGVGRGLERGMPHRSPSSFAQTLQKHIAHSHIEGNDYSHLVSDGIYGELQPEVQEQEQGEAEEQEQGEEEGREEEQE